MSDEQQAAISPSIDPTLAAGIVAVLGRAQNPAKEGVNPHYSTRYVKLANAYDALRAATAGTGVTLRFQMASEEDAVCVLASWLCVNGAECHAGSIRVAHQRDPQKMGAASTYAHRYLLCSILGIAGDDDDDAASISGDNAPRPQESSRPAQGSRPSAGPLACEVCSAAMTQGQATIAKQKTGRLLCSTCQRSNTGKRKAPEADADPRDADPTATAGAGQLKPISEILDLGEKMPASPFT